MRFPKIKPAKVNCSGRVLSWPEQFALVKVFSMAVMEDKSQTVFAFYDLTKLLRGFSQPVKANSKDGFSVALCDRFLSPVGKNLWESRLESSKAFWQPRQLAALPVRNDYRAGQIRFLQFMLLTKP